MIKSGEMGEGIGTEEVSLYQDSRSSHGLPVTRQVTFAIFLALQTFIARRLVVPHIRHSLHDANVDDFVVVHGTGMEMVPGGGA